jgi:hypothetical protein
MQLIINCAQLRYISSQLHNNGVQVCNFKTMVLANLVLMVDNIGTTIGKFTTKVHPTLESIPKWVAFGAAIVLHS